MWSSLNAGHEDDRDAIGDLAGSYGWIITKGATIIQTDLPELLLAYLRKRNYINNVSFGSSSKVVELQEEFKFP